MHRCNIVHILCCIYFPLYPPPTSQWPKVLSKVSLKEKLWNLTHTNVKSIQVTCFGRTSKRSWQYSVILKENLHHQSANISLKVIFSLHQNFLAILFLSWVRLFLFTVIHNVFVVIRTYNPVVKGERFVVDSSMKWGLSIPLDCMFPSPIYFLLHLFFPSKIKTSSTF